MEKKKTHKMHPLRVEEMRQKIRATLIINRLENHTFAKPSDEDIEDKVMTDSQVRAALGLLAKVLPNVTETNTTITGADGAPISINVNFR